jgi:hypothetical protein
MKIKKDTFVSVANLVISDCEMDVKAGLRPKSALTNYRQRMRQIYEPFFGKLSVKEIDHRNLKDFQGWLLDEWEHSASTIRVHMSFVSVVLKQAADEGLIINAPRIPRPKQKDCPRPSFTMAEYRKLLEVMNVNSRANLSPFSL